MGKPSLRKTAFGKPVRSTTGVSVVANPLAEDKLLKKTLKLVKKASKSKKIRRGVKEVQKALRKKQKGVCVLAGDISPIDVISHLPVLCEDNDVPYVFVPSKAELGGAGATKRPTSCVMVVPGDDKSWEHAELYDDLLQKVKEVQPKF
ncbi:H/ACA ribonucleoprotein complex subunit 2 [Hondaea fermentalgiana]|uniref:H/ACA ribonucleoprotein complex subunit 2 n=1 Tax=Hondaea fermentalgiana TaxID=2315210 RepID=A0A2R5H1F4_9STRA|nr:H/ACA ribonucleoprotein complex subunit 2 [Hondaea fermentalgiana]|eukprot:GBG34174.1 H/ACA ribonucleoprotein complex subunit 2 [Hondaea fermentalgiana]